MGFNPWDVAAAARSVQIPKSKGARLLSIVHLLLLTPEQQLTIFHEQQLTTFPSPGLVSKLGLHSR